MEEHISFVGGIPGARPAYLYRNGYTQQGKPYELNTGFLKPKTRGVRRWAVFEDEKAEKHWYPVSKHQRFYFMHDNGGRPFMVQHDTKNHLVKVSKAQIETSYEHPDCYQEPVIEFKDVKRVFVGKDQGSVWRFDGQPVQFADGNSLLLQLEKEKGTYVFIGASIFSFHSKEPIQFFFSTIGNNDVPYPGALTWTHYLCMNEKRKIPLQDFPEDTEWEEADYYMYHKWPATKEKTYHQYPSLDQFQLLVQRL